MLRIHKRGLKEDFGKDRCRVEGMWSGSKTFMGKSELPYFIFLSEKMDKGCSLSSESSRDESGVEITEVLPLTYSELYSIVE